MVGRDPFTYADLDADLLGPVGLADLVAGWRHRHRGAIRGFVEGFHHSVLPTLVPADVHLVLDRSSYGLAGLDKTRDTENFINRANPPWAIAYLFHDCTERLGHLPTWADFLAYVRLTATDFWWRPVAHAARTRHVDTGLAERAMRWRLATAWQSHLRTVYALTTLRQTHDLPIRYHLFAHVELGLDGWLGTQAYRIVMPSIYESRKKNPHERFAGTDLAIADLTIARQGRGSVWMPTDRALARLAGTLRAGIPPAATQLTLI